MASQYTVLLVDDDACLLNACRRILEHLSYLVFCACGAQEALSLIAQHTIDIVVTDEHMEGMTGSVLLEHIARTHPHIVRILITGHITLTTALYAINHGQVFRILQKPVATEEFLSVISQGIQAKRHGLFRAPIVDLPAEISEREMEISPFIDPRGSRNANCSTIMHQPTHRTKSSESTLSQV